jgi:hypothetical protein
MENPMSEPTIKLDKANRVLTITIPLLDQPVPSSTGKTLVVATTHGNTPSGIIVEGRMLKVGVNAFISK